MARVDPAIKPVLTALVQGLRELGVDFCVVGALVPQLLLEGLEVRTNDADVVVFVPDVETFEGVKLGLKKFSATKIPHRLEFQKGGLVDILPYSPQLAPNDTLQRPPDVVLNMAGFDQIFAARADVTLESGLVVPVVPLPLYALLKLVAYTDRKAPKDVDAVTFVLGQYAEDDERRWGLEHDGALVDYDYGPPYLLGVDGVKFLTPSLTDTLRPLLVSLTEGSTRPSDRDEEQWQPTRADLFSWYRRGLGI